MGGVIPPVLETWSYWYTAHKKKTKKNKKNKDKKQGVFKKSNVLSSQYKETKTRYLTKNINVYKRN